MNHEDGEATPSRTDRPASRPSIWRTTFPLNYKTFLFGFFSGSVLSIPCGLLIVDRWRLVTPPIWTAPIYAIVVLGSLLALPFWSAFAVGDQPPLRRCGIAISFLGLALALLYVSRL